MSLGSGELAPNDVPESVIDRELRDLLDTFQRSAWRSMTVQVHGTRIVVDKRRRPRPATADAAVAGTVAPVDPHPDPVTQDDVKRDPVAAAQQLPPATADLEVEAGWTAVRSPAVGSFWVAPGPGHPPFVEIGQQVETDQQLAIVEVMKLMNPVVASGPGTVVRICGTDGELVEYDQVLFWIRPGHD